MTTWLISDLHVGHKRIEELCQRPTDWYDILKKNIKNLIRQNDEVILLGDNVWWGGTKLDQFNRLINLVNLFPTKNIKGIPGNHDDPALFAACGIEKLPDIYEFRHNGTHCVLSHYPLASWNKKAHGSVHFHGHTHNNLENKGLRRLDVGIDNPKIGYSPISLDDAISLAIANGTDNPEKYP